MALRDSKINEAQGREIKKIPPLDVSNLKPLDIV